MQYTPNYNLITVEGTDVVNPLVQMNPNFTDIDIAMFANKQASIGSATELTSGTVHSITRANPDSNYFRFTATSNWTAGDSMNVDGVNVSVYLTDGTVPGNGAYIINTEVFGIISGSRVTLYLTNPVVSLDASSITFDPTGTSLDPASVNVDLALKDLADKTLVKLWENLNPASDFIAQTFMTSGSGYDAYIIGLRHLGNRPDTLYQFDASYIDDALTHYVDTVNIVSSLGRVQKFERSLQFNTAGSRIEITAGNCIMNEIVTYGSATASSNRNDVLKPMFVYGIKF